MKLIKILTGAFLISNLALQAQVTSDIIGYETITLKSGEYNLIGVRLLESVEVEGTLNWDGATFTTTSSLGSLEEDTPYQLEINSGINKGAVVAVKLNAAGTGLELHEIYASSSIPVFTEQDYKLRKAATINSVFGSDNSVGLQATDEFSSNIADEVIIKYGDTFEKFFYYDDGVNSAWIWEDGTNYELAGIFPIISTVGVFVYKKSAGDIEQTIAGTVKSTATLVSITDSYNYTSGVYPAGLTLANSGLQDTITTSTTFSYGEGDEVLIPDGQGDYNRYIYYNDGNNAAWTHRNQDNNFIISDDVELSSGIIIVKQEGSNEQIQFLDRNYQ